MFSYTPQIKSLIERKKFMPKYSTTIVAVVSGIILLLAKTFGVQIAPEDLQTTIDTILSIGQMVAMLIALVSGKKALGTNLLGKKK